MSKPYKQSGGHGDHCPNDARAFDHVLIIMFENQYRGYVLGNPYMRKLARQGIELGNFFGVMHPSQTNYIASIAGELCNVTSDSQPTPPLAQATIVDLIEEAPERLRWKAYMESYVAQATPWSPTFTPKDAPPYYIKHNPFSSFSSILQSQQRWKQIDNEAALFADLLNGELPEYCWFTPNIWSDGHYLTGTQTDPDPRAPVLVDQLAEWLQHFFERLRFPGPQSHLPARTLVVVTFDESDFEANYEPDLASAYDGPNQIYTVLLGDCVEPGFIEEGYNHYSLLRTIEKNFRLGHLGKNDAAANWFQFLWKRYFEWGAPQPTPFTGASGALGAAGFAGALFVACASVGGGIEVRTRSNESARWSAGELLQLDGSGGIALASTEAELLLIARSAGGVLQSMKYNLLNGWVPEAVASGETSVSAFALTSFADDSKLMLAFAQSCGAVFSSVRTVATTPGWSALTPVPAAQTDGAMTLATLGAAVYLIVKAPGAQTMNVISYNSAAFNVVTVPPNKYGGAQDNTTMDAWSPSAFPVAHFSSRPDASDEREPITQPYQSSGPMVAATLDGVLHLVHPGVNNPVLLSETFSIAGVMTPSQVVSYKSSDSATASNGFGTLAEAGWSKQTPIFDAHCHPGAALAMARSGNEILLLHRSREDEAVQLRSGKYVQKG